MGNGVSSHSADEFLLSHMRALTRRSSTSISTLNKKLLVLSTARSGSTMFCDVLNRTGHVGDCMEWFNVRYIEAYCKVMGLDRIDLSSYLHFVIEKTIGSTGVFAVNMHIEQYVDLMKRGFDPLSLNFDHIVYLSRKNKIEQAVSMAIALQSGQWSSDLMADGEVCISNADISRALEHILQSEETYRDRLSGKVHAEYVYEEFSNFENPIAFRSVLTALGKDPEVTFDTGMKKQADSLSQDLAEEFLRFISNDYS